VNPEFWDTRYDSEQFAYGTAPNAFLRARALRLPAGGRLLLPGEGEGRNGAWLAEQGFAVAAVDYSATGLEKARALAEERGVTIDTGHADLTTWDWPESAFDGVAAIFFHLPEEYRRPLHRAMLNALRPGGRLLLEGFTKDQLDYGTGGPPVPEMLFDPAELEEDFAAARLLELETEVRRLDEGPYHNGQAAVVHLVAERA